MTNQAWIHQMANSSWPFDRIAVVQLSGDIFSGLPDKGLAWRDIIKLTQDEDGYVRHRAASLLGPVFSQVPDKIQAWQDLRKLTQEEDVDVRSGAASSLGSAFSHVPDKSQAWQDLRKLTNDKNDYVKIHAIFSLASAFSHVPDKVQAWQDLHKLTQDKDGRMRCEAAKSLGSAFSHISDKTQAWQDIILLTHDKDDYVMKEAMSSLVSAFSHVPDKAQAWQDLHKLTQDKDGRVRSKAAKSLGSAFSHVPDKAQAWQDLHKLTQDEDGYVRSEAASSLGSVFSHVPDKVQAWQDLHKLIQDEDGYVRSEAASSLGSVFSHVPDKAQAWQDLIKLAKDENSNMRWKALSFFKSAFSHVPDKVHAWRDLIRLTQYDTNPSALEVFRDFQGSVASSLGSAFPHVSDKSQAWQDLIKLTQDKNRRVRSGAASSLGSAFFHVPDKAKAWQDLYKLTQDEDGDVRKYAYYYLGRGSVSKASEAGNRDNLLSELNTAISYFEKSSQESGWSPAQFCLPFYRSYFAITFQNAKGDEVKKYLKEAKKAIGDSKSKAELLKVVENLAQALQEPQKLKSRSIEEISNELNAYRWYCEKAANHMSAAEENAPGAVKLMRKCNPLLEEKIQTTIAEIQKSARLIRQATLGSGTKFEASAAEIHRQAKFLTKGDLVSVQNSSSRIVVQLLKFCKLLSEEESDSVCDVVKEIAHTSEFPEKLHLIEIALSHLNPILEAHRMSKTDVVILSVLSEEYGALSDHLINLQPPSDMGSIPNIYAWQFGEVACPKFKGTYKVAIGMTCRPGNNQSALAVKEAIQLWRPRYIIFSGIAGGLPDPKKKYADLKLGSVVIADVVYGYEYGKIDEKYEPRGSWTKNTDQGLLTSASVYAHKGLWQKQIIAAPPKTSDPKAITGEIASGEKVVDDRTNEFFAQVLKRWPKIKAVEMEGAGVGSAIEQAQSLGIAVGFMVIRGISDLLLAEEDNQSGGTDVRDDWKAYASDTAAAFTTGWIAEGLPLPPSDRSSINS